MREKGTNISMQDEEGKNDKNFSETSVKKFIARNKRTKTEEITERPKNNKQLFGKGEQQKKKRKK